MNVYQDLNLEAATTLSQHLRFFRHGAILVTVKTYILKLIMVEIK